MQHRLVATGVRLTPVVYLTAAAWLALIALTLSGSGVIRHDRLLQGGPPLWLATITFVLGWQVMVWAMMTPASLHAFARVHTGSLVRFAAGYVAVWTAFGLAIFIADAGLHELVNHWSWLANHTWVIAGSTLVACGAYQLSDLKSRSLDACRDPSSDGAVHGIQCVGSSGGLMLLAFALLPANLVAMAAVTALMAYEVSPLGRAGVKLVGYGLIAIGTVVVMGPFQLPS